MRKIELVQMRNSLIKYQDILKSKGSTRYSELTGIISDVEEFVNFLPPDTDTPVTVQAAPPSNMSKEELVMSLGMELARKVPKDFGYLFFLFGKDRTMQFVTTADKDTVLSLMRDFVNKMDGKENP